MPISSSSSQLITLLSASKMAEGVEDYVFQGLEFDSRQIRGGELFVALAGEHCHGNQFIETALSRGAALVLASNLVAVPEISDKQRVLLVEDTLVSFWQLAAWWRDQIQLPTFAVSGSVGKTTVKEMAAAILLQKGAGTYSLKSHNNHVGVPYTICRAARDHRWMVLEVGMNQRGEIAPLSELARPIVAAVTIVAPAHIGNLGSLQTIADEKLDIAAGLVSGGSLLLNAQSKVLRERMDSKKLEAQGISVEYFGADLSGSGALQDVKGLGLEGISFNLTFEETVLPVKMKVLGRQNAWNAACAAKAAKLLCPELSDQQIVAGLERFTAPLMRLNVKYLCDGSILIDDSYNANPASLTAAIELVSDLRKPNQRMGLVLGDMLELGEFSAYYHDEISQVISAAKPDFVLALGPESQRYLKGLENSAGVHMHFQSVEELSLALKDMKFDYLLVKASRGIGLDRVVISLLELRGELPFEPDFSAVNSATEDSNNI